jgi:Zn2+/Cd2+-exporting ATPase
MNDSEYFEYVSIVSVAFGIPPIALKAIRTLRRFQFDTNCLMLFAALGALGLQYFEEAAAVVFLFALSEWLEVRATTRARMALSAIVQLRPETASIVHPFTGEVLTVPAEAVPVGVVVSVRAGDKIPCDGIVVSGTSTVDESSLTGESRPIQKGPDDTVSGGTINSGKSLLAIRTTATSENSAVARLIRLVEEAQTNRSETEMMVDKFAKVYTPIVVVAAMLMCSVSWAFGKEAGRTWTNNGLVLIVVACPCALIISTPVAYVAGLAAAAQNGVLIKGGAYLESLSKVRYLCFDKTGTLTNGIFSLLHLNVLSTKLSREEVFQYLVVMEDRASHPIAQAILTAADKEKITVPKTMILEKHTIIEGEGVGGVINGLEVFVGNERMFQRLNLLKTVSASDTQIVDEWKNLGGTIGFMSVEGYGIVCAFCAADGIRTESQSVVLQLRKLGLSIFMLTGDNEDAAEAIGRQVGLSGKEIKSKLLPEEKLNYVRDLVASRTGKNRSNDGLVALGVETRHSSILSLKQEKLVMMCGDGVNDAPALAASDVGVAMGAGASIAMESADVTLLDSNLEKLSYSIQLGRRVTSKIIQNVAFSLITKLIVVGFAISGRTKLWAAICADVGAMLCVTLNAMTILPRRERHSQQKVAVPSDDDMRYDI